MKFALITSPQWTIGSDPLIWGMALVLAAIVGLAILSRPGRKH